jgi:hypothetical protein
MALIIVFVLLGASPLIIAASTTGVFDSRSFLIIGIALVAVVLLPLFGKGDALVLWQYFLAQSLLFASYIFVSRVRQRKSLFLIAVASVASNAGWFAAMRVLATAYLSGGQKLSDMNTGELLAMAVLGTVVGRLIAAQWTMWVEKRWHVGTDSVGSPTLRWLDAHTHYGISLLFFGGVIGYGAFGLISLHDLLIVSVLGFAQNAITTINSRFANRDHPGWPVVTGLAAGTLFVINWTFLIGHTDSGELMSPALLVPYTLATVAGGNCAAVASMRLEKKLDLKVDSYVAGVTPYNDPTWHRFLLLGIAGLCGVYLTMNGYFAALFSLQLHSIVLPFPTMGTEFGRGVSMVMAGVLFFLSNVTHTLSSRAGNRNSSTYHAVTCILDGMMTFWTGTFVILNARFLDIVPIAAFGTALGQLWAQRCSMGMERWLGSVMGESGEPERVVV